MTAQPATDCTLSGQPPYNCQGCDLSGRNLAGKDLTNAKLQNAKLLGTIFTGVVGMAGADLTGATMGNGTDFSGCDLSKTIFGPTPTFGTNAANLTKFVGATIPYKTLGTTWSYVDLTDAIISDLPQNLSWFEVIQSNLTRFKPGNRALKNAHFFGVTLQGADFSGGTLSNIVFGQGQGGVVCDLTGAKFVGATISAGVFDTSTLTKTNFTGATLTGASFLQTRMDGTIFDHTDVTTCTFSSPPRFSNDQANLTSFRNATLNYSTILKQWSYLDLTGATIVGLSPSVDLTYLLARYAVLAGMDLSNYTLNQCDLTGATLTGVKFSKAKMDHAFMYGVQNRCERFRVPQTSGDYQPFLAALQSNSAAGLAPTFAKNGVSLAVAQTTVRTDSPGHWWTVTDASTQATYPVTSVTSPGVPCLIVMDLNLVSRFDGATLTYANFSPNHGQPAALRGANFNGATMDHADLSQADLGQVNPYDPTTASQLKGASLNNGGLSQAILTGAQLTGTVYLHDADLSGATLQGADLTGAQLGALAELFRISQTSGDYQPFLTALQGENAAGVAAIFAKPPYNHPITAGQTSVQTTVPNRSWTITDNASQTIYTALNWTSTDKTTYLIVSTPTQAATLTGAYMPNATLVDTNLYGVSAAHLQLYGEKVRLDGAILDNCKLPSANLGGSSIVVKALYNVDLSDANLINAKLTGADLTQGVTLSYASLQGTDFTDTQMNEAILANAAVSVGLPGGVAGTYLFSVYPTDTAYQSVLAELQAAANPNNPIELASDAQTIAQGIGYLNSGDMDHVGQLFQQQGVTFPQSARIVPTGDPAAWQIISPAPPGNYTVWHGFDDLGSDALLAGPSMPNLQQVFQANSAVAGKLRWQATVSTVGLASNQWSIDNDSDNPNNLQLGYATLLVTEGSDTSLAFYGTTLRIQQLGANNKLQINIMTYNPTVLCKKDNTGVQQCGTDGSGSYFGPDTICPNTRKVSDNQNSYPSVPWEHMLRAPGPPTPPTCVPSPYADCPQVSAATLAAEKGRRP